MEPRSRSSASGLHASRLPEVYLNHSFLPLGRGPWQTTQDISGEQVGKSLPSKITGENGGTEIQTEYEIKYANQR